MSDINKPRIINLQHLNLELNQDLVVAEKGNLPFDVKRVFWVYNAPAEKVLGYHAHIKLEQLLIAVSGEINIETETLGGEKENFVLNSPTFGLYLPKKCWHISKFSEGTILVSIASMEYDEKDYIRSYADFETLKHEVQ